MRIMDRILSPREVGFDYARAILELRRELSYEQIALFCGYDGKSGIAKLVSGKTPKHDHGEALYILYVETFGKKPPLKVS